MASSAAEPRRRRTGLSTGAAYPRRVIEFVRAGRVPYLEAWDQQRALHERRVADEIDDTVLLLEHDPVYTAGKRTEPWERPVDGTPVVDVDRGGRITWHGPGQLTGYPIVKLPDPVDVVAYVRRLEDALMAVASAYEVPTVRVEGGGGVWTADAHRMVPAIGIRVARGVTMHGFALNCDCELTSFAGIVPCGITDAGVTTLSIEAGRPITVEDVLPEVEHALATLLGKVHAE